MAIESNIKKYRAQTKYSQQDLADLLNVDRKTYISWENGTAEVKDGFIPKIAEILGVEIKDLFQTESKANIKIVQKHNEGKDSSLLNGAILIITDKQSIDGLVQAVKDVLEKKD